MALARKGFRPLDVNGVRAVWRATGTDAGISVVVTTPKAFERGARQPQLSFVVPHGSPPVTPAVVRRAINLAVLDRDFLTDSGAPDPVLPRSVARAIAFDKPQDLLKVCVEKAARQLKAPMALEHAFYLASALVDVGAAVVLHPPLRSDPTLAEWADTLTQGESTTAAEALVAAADATLDRGQQYAYWAYFYRSAAEWIMDFAAHGRRQTTPDPIAIESLDKRLQAGPARRDRIPRLWLMPESHRWWLWAP